MTETRQLEFTTAAEAIAYIDSLKSQSVEKAREAAHIIQEITGVPAGQACTPLDVLKVFAWVCRLWPDEAAKLWR